MVNWLTKNWGLKLISLLLAIGLWYYAVGEESIEVTRTVPLRVIVKNPQMSILKTSARAAQVTFVAPRALLSDLTREGIRAVHEIGGEAKKAGDYSFRLENREIKIQNPQIRVTKIEPEIIQLTLDELIVQKVPVKPNFVGEPAFGYKVEESQIEISPNAVMVEGPKGQIEKIDSIKTEKIDLVGRVRSLRRTVTMDLPENLKLLSEPYIDIYVPINEASDEKNMDNIPVKLVTGTSASRKAEVQPPAVSLVLRSSPKRFEALKPQDILAFVDISSLPQGEHALPVKVVLPEGVTLKEDKPVTVKVIVKK